jgi:hypothetical protein
VDKDLCMPKTSIEIAKDKFPNVEETKHECPVCKGLLFVMPTRDQGKVLWCGRVCSSIGANEGAYGRNLTECWETFRSKMGIDK